jgi:hypothetical protein
MTGTATPIVTAMSALVAGIGLQLLPVPLTGAMPGNAIAVEIAIQKPSVEYVDDTYLEVAIVAAA